MNEIHEQRTKQKGIHKHMHINENLKQKNLIHKNESIFRLVFVNKLDRAGADPFKVVHQLRTKLNLNAGKKNTNINMTV